MRDPIDHIWQDVARAVGAVDVVVVHPGGVPDPPSRCAAGGGVIHLSADPSDQHERPVDLAYLAFDGDAPTPWGGLPIERVRAAAHQAMQHLRPGGCLAVPGAVGEAFLAVLDEFGMRSELTPEPVAVSDVLVVRRTTRTTVHDLVWEARAVVERVHAAELAGELDGDDPPTVVDTRTHTDRSRAGIIAGSIHVPRTVLEWHLDPANGYRHPVLRGLDQRLVLVCNGGYSSSLAAASLQRLGFTGVRDLVGGMRAWLAGGHAVVPADHDHLDL
ncbi:MAG: hypothetical protein KDB40_13480 [Acidimicrobiales bacterium]|nr:hypothetical protein [Acidimicrobiales bacterium]MCB9396053.1 hypothetical protein [Acidimicrobiaceae bacterium]